MRRAAANNALMTLMPDLAATRPEGDAASLALPGFEFDFMHAELRTASGERVPLRPQVLDVLRCLARRPGFMVAKEELMRSVWPKVVVGDDSLVQCIRELRQALHDTAHRVVITEPRRGYRLMAAAAAPVASAAVASAAVTEADANEPPAFHQDIRFATTPDGVRLAYAASGQGAPLVRTAHWMTHLDWDWRSATLGPPIRAMSQRHRLIRYDGRGYGLSDWDAGPGSLEQGVADLEAVADSAGVQTFALLGASTGAPVAIRFAARHPRRVSALVLLGGFARGVLRRGTASTSADNFNAMLRLIEDGWSRDNPAFRQLLTSLHWPGASAQQMQSFNHLQRVSCTPQTAVALMRRDAEIDVSGDLGLVRCPTLVLHSPRDARVPFEEGRLVAGAIRGARLETFDSPNHLPLLGEPAFDLVLRQVHDFVLGHAAPRRMNGHEPASAPIDSDAATRRAPHAVGGAAAARNVLRVAAGSTVQA
jgi:pimeloyl-ACP methyl ester carboxylesterase/DNA-binding winged helix-turn-helix (wHTH) protein